MTVRDLAKMLAKQFGLKGPRVIRNLERGTVYSSEDADMLLKSFSQFQEGGARITLESGEFCSINEIALKVYLYGAEEYELKHFKFNNQ
jgi:hypothetical protein